MKMTDYECLKRTKPGDFVLSCFSHEKIESMIVEIGTDFVSEFFFKERVLFVGGLERFPTNQLMWVHNKENR